MREFTSPGKRAELAQSALEVLRPPRERREQCLNDFFHGVTCVGATSPGEHFSRRERRDASREVANALKKFQTHFDRLRKPDQYKVHRTYTELKRFLGEIEEVAKWAEVRAKEPVRGGGPTRRADGTLRIESGAKHRAVVYAYKLLKDWRGGCRDADLECLAGYLFEAATGKADATLTRQCGEYKRDLRASKTNNR